jgi:hypothetical protein
MSSRKLAAPALARKGSDGLTWMERETLRFEKGQRRNPPTLPPMELFNRQVQVSFGTAEVPEDLTFARSLAVGGTETVPLWHVMVQDLHFVDVTNPEVPPLFPLPEYKPHRAEAEKVAQTRLAHRAANALLGKPR